MNMSLAFSVDCSRLRAWMRSLARQIRFSYSYASRLGTGRMYAYTVLSTMSSLLISCNVNNVAPSNSQQLISAYQYSTSYFLLDTLYSKFFESQHQASRTGFSYSDEEIQNWILTIDVWLTLSPNQSNSNPVLADAYIDLPGHQVNESYPDDITYLLRSDSGGFESGRFYKLDHSEFSLNYSGGYLALNHYIPDDQAIAVSYSILGKDKTGGTYDDIIFGPASVSDTVAGGRFLLKLVKPRFLKPRFKPAWNLIMRNVYKLAVDDLSPMHLSLKIIFGQGPNEVQTSKLLGVDLLTACGLDRYDSLGYKVPDTKFDFAAGITVDLRRSELIFPSLRPFDSALVQYFRRAQPNTQLPDSILQSELYEDYIGYTVPTNILGHNSYNILVTSKR